MNVINICFGVELREHEFDLFVDISYAVLLVISLNSENVIDINKLHVKERFLVCSCVTLLSESMLKEIKLPG